MAKLTAPLLALKASGTLKKTLVFSTGKHFAFVASKFSPVKKKDIPTAGRLAQRKKYSDGVLAWKQLDTKTKAYYNTLRYPVSQTGFNRFLSRFIRQGIASSNFPYLLPVNF